MERRYGTFNDGLKHGIYDKDNNNNKIDNFYSAEIIRYSAEITRQSYIGFILNLYLVYLEKKICMRDTER